MKKPAILLALVIVTLQLYAQTTIIPYGSSWKYLDNGSNQGTTWTAASFNDAAWAAGNGQLGYGDGDEATILSYGSNANNKYITSYFRKTISITNVSQYSGYSFSVKRDDGIVIYVNGTEVYRNNMPTGAIVYSTLASTAASDDGATAQTVILPASAFIEGNNTIAVEIHQNAGTSSDISFDLQLTGTLVPTSTSLVAYGSAWKYLDNGTNQGTAWRTASFNDAAWKNGNGQLGYGDGDETTIVSYGGNANNKYITTYFRKTISITNASLYTSYSLSVKRDDGIVIYINGTEVYRNNMPAGTIAYNTLASTAASDDGAIAQTATLASSSFITGNNTIAVEVHQNVKTSSDLSFDLQLVASGSSTPQTALLTRGPYLQMGNQTAVTLRWRTDIATNTKFEAGISFGNYSIAVNDAASVTEHEIRLTGLTPDTKYYYRFGSSTQTLQAGTDNYFTTSPVASTTRKIRIAAFGDCGRNDNTYQSSSLSSYANYVGANPAEVLLLLGDNAYDAGTDAEYQAQYFNIYSSTVLKNHQLFPAPGNHDYANTAARQSDHNIPYYSIFSNPSAAQCGGVASGTEAYYSWDWGNIHFLSLDSYGLENSGTTRLYDTTGAQAVWVKQDLAANTKPWVIAYWHHPPYTMGSHNSDTETELINMRQKFITILERMGVDLIICGHSHNYERSYLLNGYYGNEASFNPATHTLSSSSAKYDGSANSCPYSTGSGANHGTVYVVAGSAGASGSIQSGYPHNALPYSVNDGGTLYLEIEDNRLDAKFIRRTGVVWDNFTIMKDVNKTNTITSAPGAQVQLTASWPGTYSWSTGETTRTITVNPSENTTYTVRDATSSTCVTDVFNVDVTGSLRRMNTVVIDDKSLKIAPTFVQRGQPIQIITNENKVSEIIITDVEGRIMSTDRFSNKFTIQTSKLPGGIYFLRLKGKGDSHTRKFVVMD
ncbi:MAG: metallophosphoesterase [Bacteroidetes bacterium]|nr:metallophosphoesterase [Bacteroidota bacterium]MBS1608744.1 metallophosphoesterase [Bacteroidota bacterium]